MSKRKEFGEGPIYTITNYIWWFLLGSLYFWLLNIPLLLTFLALGEIKSGVVITLLSASIPVGPAAAALFSAMGKLVRNKDVDITKDFFRGYKTNFKQSMLVWLLELLLLYIMYIDIQFFSLYRPVLKYVFYILAVFIVITGLYALSIISRFYTKTKNVIKLAFYCSFKYIMVNILIIAIIMLSGFIMLKIPPILTIFIVSIVFYGIMYFEKDVLKEIEGKFQQKEEE